MHDDPTYQAARQRLTELSALAGMLRARADDVEKEIGVAISAAARLLLVDGEFAMATIETLRAELAGVRDRFIVAQRAMTVQQEVVKQAEERARAAERAAGPRLQTLGGMLLPGRRAVIS
jgi:hypothetical protein